MLIFTRLRELMRPKEARVFGADRPGACGRFVCVINGTGLCRRVVDRLPLGGALAPGSGGARSGNASIHKVVDGPGVMQPSRMRE